MRGCSTAEWQRVWSNRLFTEVNAGQWGYDFPLVPSTDYRVSPPRTDLVTGVDTGAGFTQGGTAGPHHAEPEEAAGVCQRHLLPADAHTGSHDLKAGVEWLDDAGNVGRDRHLGRRSVSRRQRSADQIRLTDVGDPAAFGSDVAGVRPTRTAARLAVRAGSLGADVQVTVTGGLRYDRQRPYYDGSSRAPVLADVFPAAATPGATLFVRNNLAPRVGISIDPDRLEAARPEGVLGPLLPQPAQTSPA